MNFTFFTFGGFLVWEDVFFYQKWRIQRNCITKTFRLLDSWDIRRASGTFDECKESFIKYIKSYEIAKQQGKMVILLHGYLGNKNAFKRLWRKLILTNTVVASLNYPSLFRDTLSSAHQLLFFLNHMDNINEVSFITYGMGNLVLQKALNLPPHLQTFRESTRVANIVEINPIVQGNLLSEFLMRYKIFRLVCGPSLEDMTEKKLKKTPLIPSNINLLQIFSPTKLQRLRILILKLCKLPIEETTPLTKNAIFIYGNNYNPLKSEEILNKTVKFVKNGKI